MTRRIITALAALAVLAAPCAAQDAQRFPFDPTAGKWPFVLSRMVAQEPVLTSCITANVCGTPSLAAWRVIVTTAAGRVGIDRLAYVNAAIDRTVTWRSTQDVYGTADYWATPAQTLARGLGACADVAILKLWTLKLAGSDVRTLNLLVVNRDDGPHMVLRATTPAGTFVLDQTPTSALIAAADYTETPLYTLDVGGASIFGTIFRINDVEQAREKRQ